MDGRFRALEYGLHSWYHIRWGCVFCALLCSLIACNTSPDRGDLFSRLSQGTTGVTFVNEIQDRPGRHILRYEYFYNGGGVAIGDVNGDSLPDLFFTATMGPNRLYVNRGNLRFEEVTSEAGIQATDGWSTGVTMADVNGDGHLDIYVCQAGRSGLESRQNRLYVNDGDGTFTERSQEYGVDSPSYSTHATFFDYDRDGDLDLYLLNYPPGRNSRIKGLSREGNKKMGRDRLYRNDFGEADSSDITFVDVTETAGLAKRPVGYGLGVMVSDINRDGWPDIYVANDYEGEDRLYVNQGDGSFADSIGSWIDHMSASSMGVDIADYNNDGWPDIYVADMLPKDNRRKKLLRVTRTRTYGKSSQYMRNMLQLHNGRTVFSEIGRLAGVSSTDWSWAPLFADFDLDGYKDLFVTNGFRRDVTNLDFLHRQFFPAFTKNEATPNELYKLVDDIPSTPISNYAFRNQGDLTFRESTQEWGLEKKGFSNGAAYGDLDVDGDLDLVINNINEPAWIYRNNAVETTDRHYLRVQLAGGANNRFGVGAKVTVTTQDGTTHYQEMSPSRGFQSSVDPVLLFGLGKAETVDVSVIWPDQTRECIRGVRVDQKITLHQAEAASEGVDSTTIVGPQVERQIERLAPEDRGLDFRHRENPYVDYEAEPLIPHLISNIGPALARGDVNGDGREDLFIGGARGQASALFLQVSNGTFSRATIEAFRSDAAFEDVDATFLDVNDDGHKDLYVVSGGRSEVLSNAYKDRVYMNDGSGSFRAAPNRLPAIESSGGAVAKNDYDGDGDVDLFVGGRVRSVGYPLSPQSFLLENQEGSFEDVTEAASQLLRRPGMVTDVGWADVTGDKKKELLLVGEWMPVRVFQLDGEGAFKERTAELGLEQSNGWWNCLEVADLDGDNDKDIFVGNRGGNSTIKARPDEPVSVYVGDFDRDGDREPIMTQYNGGREYPVPRWGKLVNSLPIFRAQFSTYEAYASATIEDVLSAEQRDSTERLTAYTFATSVFEQTDGGTFVRHDLDVRAQFSPTRGILVHDVNEDGRPDLILAGNDLRVRHPWGPSDAGKGEVLLNEGDLQFKAVSEFARGFFAPGDVRDLVLVNTPEKPLIVVGNNNSSIGLFRVK